MAYFLWRSLVLPQEPIIEIENKDEDYYERNLPVCWDKNMAINASDKNKWLIIKDKMLGCISCKNARSLLSEKNSQGMAISKEWKECKVTHNGFTKSQMLTSLRKKIFLHKNSRSHIAAETAILERENRTLENTFISNFNKDKEITGNVFRTVYKLCKKNQPFYDF